jgi:hypothetical protein
MPIEERLVDSTATDQALTGLLSAAADGPHEELSLRASKYGCFSLFTLLLQPVGQLMQRSTYPRCMTQSRVCLGYDARGYCRIKKPAGSRRRIG